MHLKSLSLINFKNYAQAEFELNEGINCFVGKNGAGKTNVLDAVHYLSMCKSYLNPVDKQNIRFNEQFFVVQGTWQEEDKETEIYCGVKAGAKKIFKRNKAEYEKLADHIGSFPSVIISPYDRDLIAEGSEVRRRWMDGIISQFDRKYLDYLVRYSKILDQRNALLKHFYENGFFERESMDVWDAQLIHAGKAIHERRKAFLEEFIPVFQSYYQFIGEESEVVKLEYRSALNDCSFEELLEQNRRKDSQSQFTTGGTHKDDLLFTIKGHPVKKFGSQGQQKSFLIALRLAQFDWLKKHLNKKPVLMLDDIFDKLDHQRVEKLMSLVSDHVFGQVLVTDTESERIKAVFSKIDMEYQIFNIDSSTFQEVIYE
jgi:DNA replication and repair protein RecF